MPEHFPTPLLDKVFVIADEPSDEETGGIIQPETVTKKTSSGRVVAVGPGKFTENGVRLPPQLRVGDIVLFPDYAGYQTSYNSQPVLVMREDEIFATDNPAGSPIPPTISAYDYVSGE